MSGLRGINVYFSDIFGVSEEVIEEYGAFNISLINDMPLFIDPFLLFNSDNPDYQKLHEEIINYICFLRDEAGKPTYNLKAKLELLYSFKEVKQNWLGFCLCGNDGRALGPAFAKDLYNNLNTIFNNFDNNDITQSPHIEKLCLISNDVGKDKISDFTVNLIKGYLLWYTQEFAQKYISSNMCKEIMIQKVRFNYRTKTWVADKFYLPYFNNDFVILTPKDILTRKRIFINRDDMLNRMYDIVPSIEDDTLRYQLNEFFRDVLERKQNKTPYSKEEKEKALVRLISDNPDIMDYYIKYKENTGEQAVSDSKTRVEEIEQILQAQTKAFICALESNTNFYKRRNTDAYSESLSRVHYLKQVIENNDGYKVFYIGGKPITNEKMLHIMFRLTWFASEYDVNSEVNNGRGPVDYKVSYGSVDMSLIEFKLASNSKLKQNLAKQTEIYAKANQTNVKIKVILYFTEGEYAKTRKILNELNLNNKENVILINGINNKPSASNVKIDEE